MLAALLLNVANGANAAVGPILRKRGSSSIGRDVQKAAGEIERILFPSAIPDEVKRKLIRPISKVAEISELPSVTPAVYGLAAMQTATAIQFAEQLLIEMEPQPWFVELQAILIRLNLIQTALNDDEEALLLLM